MKILFSHRYFWPDTPPYAAMLRSIADHFADHGHDVHIFASKPSYHSSHIAPSKELLGKLQVRRIRVFTENKNNPLTRALNVLIYCIALFFQIIRLRPDVVTAATFPPIIAGRMASLAARLVGARFVYHMQDIHPEVSRYSGGALGKGLTYRILRALDSQTLRSASAIVVLSEDMADTLRQRDGADELPIHVINNFLLDSFDDKAQPPTALVKPADKTRVIFAGNLGAFQNLPLLAEGVARAFAYHPELELFFLGNGSALPALKERWGSHPQVRFGPYLPFEQARALIAEADIGLVSLTPGIYHVSYPSKVLTYLGMGVPVLALVEPDSKLANDIQNNGLGKVPESANPESIANALLTFLDKNTDRQQFIKAIKRYHETRLSREIILARWAEPLLATRDH